MPVLKNFEDVLQLLGSPQHLSDDHATEWQPSNFESVVSRRSKL